MMNGEYRRNGREILRCGLTLSVGLWLGLAAWALPQTALAAFDQTSAKTIAWFYAAAFGRTPVPDSTLPDNGDLGGLIFWTDAFLEGEGDLAQYNNLDAIGDFFVASEEFQAKYPATLTDEQFVTALYDNMLNREPDPAGFDFWVNELSSQSRGAVLVDFANTLENQGAIPDQSEALDSFILFIANDNSMPNPETSPDEAAVWLAANPTLDGACVDSAIAHFLNESLKLAKQSFVPSIPQNIIELDPPLDGLLKDLGLVFEEYNSIRGDKYFDNHVFALETRPRGNVYRQPLQIINDNTCPPRNVPYVLANYFYSDPIIQPPLTTIPMTGQYIAGLNVIHLVPGSSSSFPIILTINSNGFLRFTGEPPRTFGSSYRVATHNVGSPTFDGDTFEEEFPRIVKVATEVIDASRIRLTFLVDSEAFMGALLYDLAPGIESTMDVKATFIMRRDLNQHMEINTGFAGMSSLFFQGEAETPGILNDEAHDADVLVITYSDETNEEFSLINPATAFSMDFNAPSGRTITSFALEQRDRDPASYSAFSSAEYWSRSSLAIEKIRASVPFKVTLQIFPTESEFFDNVVAHLTVLDDLKKGDIVRMSYRLRAF